MIYKEFIYDTPVLIKKYNVLQKYCSKSKCHLYINYIFTVFRLLCWELIIQNQIKTHIKIMCALVLTHTQTKTDTWCQGEGKQWKMQAWELWQLCPQRLASGPIWQPALHTHIHTHTCQIHLLLEPTEHWRAKMGLATQSLEESLYWAHKACVWLFQVKIFTSSFVFILIADSWYILKPLSINPNCLVCWVDRSDLHHWNFK